METSAPPLKPYETSFDYDLLPGIPFTAVQIYTPERVSSDAPPGLSRGPLRRGGRRARRAAVAACADRGGRRRPTRRRRWSPRGSEEAGTRSDPSDSSPGQVHKNTLKVALASGPGLGSGPGSGFSRCVSKGVSVMYLGSRGQRWTGVRSTSTVCQVYRVRVKLSISTVVAQSALERFCSWQRSRSRSTATATRGTVYSRIIPPNQYTQGLQRWGQGPVQLPLRRLREACRTGPGECPNLVQRALRRLVAPGSRTGAARTRGSGRNKEEVGTSTVNGCKHLVGWSS